MWGLVDLRVQKQKLVQRGRGTVSSIYIHIYIYTFFHSYVS